MKTGIGGKVLGWFIVDESEEAAPEAREPEAEVEAEARPVLAAAPRPRSPLTPHVPAPAAKASAKVLVPPGGAHDAAAFAAVYRSGGASDEERARLATVLSLIESLPPEASVEVKRAIVGASLKAFGVSIEGIMVTGRGALDALDAYVVEGQGRTKEVLAQAESRIAALTAEIAEVRRLIDVQLASQQELTRSAAAERARVQSVLEFFEG